MSALAGAAFTQTLAGMDRTERSIFLGESPTERTQSGTGGLHLTAMPYYSYFIGDGIIVSGPGARIFFSPMSNGMGRTVASYRYDTDTMTGFGHLTRDLFVTNVQLTPDSFPVTITGTYTNDNLRNSSRFTGWGATASKSFGFGPGQTLELSVTGTSERISFPGLPNDGQLVESGTVWDAAAGIYYEGGVSLLFDYVFKSDFEGVSSWWTQVSVPFTKNIRSRFILAQHNITGFQIGWKF
jgi:hypothetical protein